MYVLCYECMYLCLFFPLLCPDLLMLGSTRKVIRPTNQNNGVASVALVTLQKLVVPLKILNINDREFVLLKEIVLFNPGMYVCARSLLLLIAAVTC